MSASEVVERYFLENRARLLEVAAFLDRVDRAARPEEGRADFRYQALRKALELLLTCDVDRAAALQLCFSDPTDTPIESAAGLKGAFGAWRG